MLPIYKVINNVSNHYTVCLKHLHLKLKQNSFILFMLFFVPHNDTETTFVFVMFVLLVLKLLVNSKSIRAMKLTLVSQQCYFTAREMMVVMRGCQAE